MIVVRRMHHSPAWGLWDHTRGTWYAGRYEDTYYYAGVPAWGSVQAAEAVLARLQGAL